MVSFLREPSCLGAVKCFDTVVGPTTSVLCLRVLNSLTFFHQVSDVCLVLGANTNLSLICQKRLQLRIVDEWIKKCILEGRNEREIIHCKLRQGFPDCVTLKKLICLNKQWPQCSVTSTSKPVVCIYWFPCLDICWATFSYFSFQTRVSWEHSSFHLKGRCGFTGRGHLAHQHHANFIWEYSTPLSSHQFYLFFSSFKYLSGSQLKPCLNQCPVSTPSQHTTYLNHLLHKKASSSFTFLWFLNHSRELFLSTLSFFILFLILDIF